LWEKEQREALTSLIGKEVWVLFSGGKDSSLSLHFLHTASKKFGFSIEAHAGIYPKHRYTPSEIARIEGFWEEKGVQILWHDVDISDDFLETAENPCAVCQKARKRLLYNVVTDRVAGLSKLVLVTAYSLSDLVSYSLEYLLGATYSSGDPERVQVSRQRFIETGQRFYPLVKMDGGLTIYRPILTYNNKNIIEIVGRNGVPILSTPCEYAHFRPKRILETYYESMSLDFDYHRLFEFARTSLELPHIDEYVSMSKEHFLKRVF
jgi:tRNA(Ile)-lysidine synthase TilS/MesJ